LDVHPVAPVPRPLATWPALAALCLASACGRRGADEPPPVLRIPSPLEIEITGHDFGWKIRYPGADGRLGTADDVFGQRHLHLPQGTETRLHLRSRDYVYTLALPHLGLKEIAVPDLEFSLSFSAGERGTYELRGDQLCGYAHHDLIGTVIVESPSVYAGEMTRLGRE
jgi:cytochrome c oxidase subunit 2